VSSRLTVGGAGSVLAVENVQTAPLPVRGYQNQLSASPTVARSDSFQVPPDRVKT
jgi:hypothetical protein